MVHNTRSGLQSIKAERSCLLESVAGDANNSRRSKLLAQTPLGTDLCVKNRFELARKEYGNLRGSRTDSTGVTSTDTDQTQALRLVSGGYSHCVLESNTGKSTRGSDRMPLPRPKTAHSCLRFGDCSAQL